MLDIHYFEEIPEELIMPLYLLLESETKNDLINGNLLYSINELQAIKEDSTRLKNIFKSSVLCLYGTDIIGFGKFSYISQQKRLNHNIQIGPMLVHGNFRGQGIGNKIIQYGLDYFSRASSEELLNFFLFVNSNNIPAISLYQNAGFSIIGIRESYLHISGQFIDAYEMHKKINTLKKKT